jgi:hypothetical protein
LDTREPIRSLIIGSHNGQAPQIVVDVLGVAPTALH